MALIADLRALMIQLSAPYTVRYGNALYFTGTDLPKPVAIKVPTRHGLVRCEVYRPHDPAPSAPAYVHFHGGAFLMRYPRMDDFFARIVAAELGAVVVNVDYDVAPQVRFPVAQHQAHDVAAWVAGHGEQLGIDGSRVALGGFSAGGNLAASAALQARDLGSFSPASQFLGVPSLDVAGDVSAKTSPLARPMIGTSMLDLVRATYFPDVPSRSSAYASPLRAPSVKGLPPTVLVTAEYDLLRAEGDAYAERLREAGNDLTHHIAPRADHYFLDAGDRQHARQTLDLIVGALRRHLGASEPIT